MADKPKKPLNVGEQLLTGTVAGAGAMTANLAGVMRQGIAPLQSLKNRTVVDVKPPVQSGVMARVWHSLTTSGKDLEKEALINAQQHQQQMAPAVAAIDSVLKSAQSAGNEAQANLAPHLNSVGRVAEFGSRNLPTLLTSGVSKGAAAANRIIGAVDDYGEGKSIPGILSGLVIPGNSVASNVAQPIVTDAIANKPAPPHSVKVAMRVPGFAEGGMPPVNEVVAVGEKGPEIAMSESGAQIVGSNGPELAMFRQPTVIVPNDAINVAERLDPEQFVTLLESPEFAALPTEDKGRVFENGAREAAQSISQSGGWNKDTWTGWRSGLANQRAKIAAGETTMEKVGSGLATVGGVLKDSLATVGTTVVGLSPVVPGQGEKGDQLGLQVPGETLVPMLAQNVAKLNESIAGKRVGGEDALDAHLNKMRGQIDSGDIPFDGPGMSAWLDQQNNALQGLQKDYYTKRQEAPEVTTGMAPEAVAARKAATEPWLAQNNLAHPSNAAALQEYLHTGSESSFQALRKNLLKTPEEAAIEKERQRLSTETPLGKALKRDAQGYIQEAVDPAELAGNVAAIGSGGAAVAAKGILRKAGSLALGAAGEALSEQVSQLMDDPNATAAERWQVVKDSLIGSLGLAGAGAAGKAVMDAGSKAQIEQPISTASVTQAAGVTLPNETAATSDAGAGSSPAAGDILNQRPSPAAEPYTRTEYPAGDTVAQLDPARGPIVVETGVAPAANQSPDAGQTINSQPAQAGKGGPGASSQEEWGSTKFGSRILKAAPELKGAWAQEFQNPQYRKRTEAEWEADSARWIDQMGIEGAASMVFDPESGLEGNDRVALGGMLMDRVDRQAMALGNTTPEGKAANDMAYELATWLSENATKAGQEVRAYGFLVNRDPRLLLEKAVKDQQTTLQEDFATNFEGVDPQALADEIKRRVDEELAAILGRMGDTPTAMRAQTEAGKRKQPTPTPPQKKPRSPEATAAAAVDSMAAQFSDTPPAQNVTPQNAVRQMINASMSADAMPGDLTAQFEALGVTPQTAGQLVRLIDTARSNAKAVARERAGQKLIQSLQPKAKTAKAKKLLLPAVDKMLQAAQTGVLGRNEFYAAYAEAQGIKPFDDATKARLVELARAARDAPEGLPKKEANAALSNELALHSGVTAKDALWSSWYSNLLAGFSTQVVNLKGNWDSFREHTKAVLISSHPAESYVYMRAVARGALKGVEEAVAAMRGQGTFKRGDTIQSQNTAELLAKIKWGDKTAMQKLATVIGAGPLAKYIFRSVAAGDGFFYRMNEEGVAALAAARAVKAQGHKLGSRQYYEAIANELGLGEPRWNEAMAQAAEEARKGNKNANWIKRRAWDIVDESRSAQIKDEAAKEAAQRTFNQDPEGLSSWVDFLIGAVQKIPLLGRFNLPFRKVVANLMNYKLAMSPIGLMQGIWGSEIIPTFKNGKVQAAAQFTSNQRKMRIALGAIGSYYTFEALAKAWAHADEDDKDVEFMIYGYGPSNKAQRAALMERGWRPFTIKVDGKYKSYSEVPGGYALAVVGGLMDAKRYSANWDDQDMANRFQYVVSKSADIIWSQGALSGLSNLVDMMRGEVGISAIARPVAGLIPGQGLLRDIANTFDPTKISPDTVAAAILRDVPVIRDMVGRPELNAFGEAVTLPGLPIMRRFEANERPHPLWDFLVKHNLKIPVFERGIEAGAYLPAGEKTSIKANRLDAKILTDEERYRYIKLAGPMIKQSVQALKADYEASPMPPDVMQRVLNNKVQAAKRIAMREVLVGP